MVDLPHTITQSRLPPLTIGNLALALLALPLFVFTIGRFEIDLSPAVSIGVQWMLAISVVVIALQGEDLSLPNIGFRRPTWIDIKYTIGTTIAILLIYIYIYRGRSTRRIPGIANSIRCHSHWRRGWNWRCPFTSSDHRDRRRDPLPRLSNRAIDFLHGKSAVRRRNYLAHIHSRARDHLAS